MMTIYQKTVRAAAIGVAVLALCIPAVRANPPRDIDITYNGTAANIFVVHPSAKPTSHYIKTIIVYVNGKENQRQTFSSQEPDGQAASYTIKALKPGDRLTVYAACSIYGDVTKTKTLE